MVQSAIATAADYADAMMTARKAKNALVAAILFMLLGQLALFFVAHFKPAALPFPTSDTTGASQAVRWLWDWARYATGAIDFLGIVLSIVLAVDLLLIVNIMLIGRLIGVSQLTGAFICCVLLGVLLFPWQAFLANATFNSPEFRIPGVLYTWEELMTRATWHSLGWDEVALRWGRFVVFPLFAMILICAIQVKSKRGLKLALGEVTAEIDEDRAALP